MSGAARAVSDCARCDTADPEVFKQLKNLHPAASQPLQGSNPKSADVIPEDDFLNILSTLPPRRAPDAAGWRGEYLKRLSPSAKEYVFKLAQHILQAPKSLPAELQPFLFGARLIALS